MAKTISGRDVLAKFFDEGAYQVLCGEQGTVTAAFGSANGTPVYAVCQNGEATGEKDIDKMVKVLDMAAATGNPVVTFYASAGAKLAEGLGALNASAKLCAAVARVSGVVPQIAVVIGVCGATSALAAAGADVCIMSEEGELFFTPPFTSAAAGDVCEDAGKAAFAEKAGVAALVVKDATEAAAQAAHLVSLMPANNLCGPALFDAAAPSHALNLAKYAGADAAAALCDEGSLLELWAGYGKNVYTAIATVGGNVVGVVATAGNDEGLCHTCVSKAARFVRLCDAFSIPLVTLCATAGFAKSTTDDAAGGVREAARLAASYADATTAKIAVVTGKAVGPAWVALCSADLAIAVEGCTISPLEPQTAVSVLYKEEIDASDNIAVATQKKAAQWAAETCSATAALNAGLADFAVQPADVRATLVGALDMLSTKRTQRLPKKHGNMAL